MRHRQDPSPALMALSVQQEHTLSRRQCMRDKMGTDVIQRLIHTTWRVITPGVYATHHLPVSWLARAWTGVHLGGPTAMLSGWAAAHVHGFATEPRLISLWVGKTPPVPRPGIFFRRDTIGRRSARLTLPVTSVADTVIDLATQASPTTMASLIADACNATAITPDQILSVAEGRERLNQRGLLAECLTMAAKGVESALELRYVRDVEQAHGLPEAQRQVWTSGARVDALLTQFGVVLELDGQKGHIGTGAFRDMARDNRHLAQGLATLRYGWDDVTDRACDVARQIAGVLAQRGWSGPFLRCPHCRLAPLQIAG